MGEHHQAGNARFGEVPLAQTVAAATAIRRLSSMLLALEHDHPTVDAMLSHIGAWETELSSAVSPDSAPRIGDDDGNRRVYLDHATDIGAFNPCFPEYRFEHIDGKAAAGTVTFPLVYEGPPGLVHGGFLAVVFDCVVQHHNCVIGRSGKTRSLQVVFRRPTPLQTALRFEIARSEVDRRITSTATLLLGGEVLCTGEVDTVASRPETLTGHRFGKRRTETS